MHKLIVADVTLRKINAPDALKPLEIFRGANPTQIIDHDDIVTALDETSRTVRPDEPGSAGNKDFHLHLPLLGCVAAYPAVIVLARLALRDKGPLSAHQPHENFLHDILDIVGEPPFRVMAHKFAYIAYPPNMISLTVTLAIGVL